jgi:hypothetical protein
MSEELLPLLNDFQAASRREALDQKLTQDLSDRRRTDVTGRWLGFDSEGFGRVEYRGTIYQCILLSNKCKQKFARVNLRRTPRGNFVDWQ